VKQTTIGRRVSLRGAGVHQARPTLLSLSPADAGSGYTFLRTGLAGGAQRIIDGRFSSVTQTDLCTVIGENPASVSTIEHMIAALAGLGVDNAMIEIDGPEVPIMDGSSKAFVEAIDEAGVVELDAPRKVIKVLRPVEVQLGRASARLEPQHHGFTLDVEIDFDTPVIGRQRRITHLSPDAFRKDIGFARTFGFYRDLEKLLAAGFAKGASLDNTVALNDDGVMNPEGLRASDEFVRHKTLDAIGDLALAGRRLQGRYVAFCPGHKLNNLVLHALFADPANYTVVSTESLSRGAGAISLPQTAALAPEAK
jgi:UDP-3-O-[3-hydroxymyristoyl] N-acetylglucosamine deacetylase